MVFGRGAWTKEHAKLGSLQTRAYKCHEGTLHIVQVSVVYLHVWGQELMKQVGVKLNQRMNSILWKFE